LFLESEFGGHPSPEFTIYSDEVWFTLSGYISSQINRYWGTEITHTLHDQKVEVWCAVSVWSIAGTILFQETINATYYV
jgi:hypothetical protein